MDKLKIRRWIVVALVLTVFGLYVSRLMDIQIVQADYYRNKVESHSTGRQVISAARGEVVDRNGLSMVSNRLGYDVVIDKAYFPSDRQNDIILRLIGLFEENGAQWIDSLPITQQAPFEFLTGYDSELATLKKLLKVQDYSTVDDVMYRLIERYKLQDYTQTQARKIAAVRYEMERRDFSMPYPYTFANDIEIDLVLQIKELNHQLLGVDVIESALRRYDMGTTAPHLIGTTGPIYREEWNDYESKGYELNDIVGKSGVEAAFEEYLRGVKGERLITIDAGGQVVSATDSIPPEPGSTIVLTLDTKLQTVAENALEAQIKYLQQTAPAGKGQEADVGAVVVIQPKTGQILSLVTYPSYDLNTYLQDYSELVGDTEGMPLFNRALQGVYAPGSIFKPVVGTAGMAQGVVQEATTVFCGLVYTRFADYQPKCLRADGNINLNRALSYSCNIYFYDVGYNLGIDNIDKYARQYGLGEPTGIELAEETGRRSNPETAKAMGKKWNQGDVLQSSIGQLYHGFTPLQMANYTATIANRGTRMKATIVKEIQDYGRKNVIEPFQPVVADQVDASKEDIEAVVRGMVSASRTGTALSHFANYPVDVASKTGTPEDVTHPNSTFIAFAPAEDPEIAIAVVIENGWHGYTGAPVAKAIMNEYFGYDEPVPSIDSILNAPKVTDTERVMEASGESSENEEL